MINSLVGTPPVKNLEPPKDAQGYYVFVKEIEDPKISSESIFADRV